MEKEIIAATLSLFSQKVRDLVPLRHICEHHNEAKIRDAVKQETDKGCVFFMKKLNKASTISLDRRGVLVGEFCSDLQRLVDKYVAMNQESKVKWESFLEKQIDGLCDDMRAFLEMQLAINPDMDLLGLEGLFESRKVTVMTYFEWLWKEGEGNMETFEEQRTKLEQKLQDLKKEMLGKQKPGPGQEDRKACGDGSELQMESPLQITNEVGATREWTNQNVVKEEINDIADRLKQMCSALIGISGKLGAQPQELPQEPEFPPDSSFVENDNETPEVQQQEQSMEIVDRANNDNIPWSPNAKLESDVDFDSSEEADVVDEGDQESNLTEASSIVATPASASNELQAVVLGCSILRTNEPHKSFAEDILEDDGGVPIESTGGEKLESDPNFDLNEEANVMDERDHVSSLTEPSLIDAISAGLHTLAPEISHKIRTYSSVVNAPEGDEYVPPQPLRAISEGQSVASIQKLLDAANVNASWSNGFNAAHLAMLSVIDGKWTSSEALAVLNLLMAKGFSIINQKIVPGHTPLLLALELENLDEELLQWFYENGADFNVAENEFGNSVLFEAIIRGFDAELIRKILEFGADPKHVNKKHDSVLHVAAYCAHDAALEIFIDPLDVNDKNKDDSTPLSMIFMQSNLGYQHCLELLLWNFADLRGSCDKGCANTLVHWLKHGKQNPFPALMNTRDSLPITEEIASATLTTIVEEIARLEKFLLSSSELEQRAFAQFTVFLIEEKKAKLLVPRGESNGKLGDLKDLEKFLLATDFLEKLRNSGIVWKGVVMKIKSATLVKFDFQTDCSNGSGTVSVPTKVVLGCLLACGSYKGFVNVCQSLNMALKEHDA